jgi:hypothetical protein
MNTLPKRRKKPRRRDMNRVPAHLQWIRGHECLVCDQECNGGIEAAHVRTGTGGGMGMKPHDRWTVPLCTYHHSIQHAMGEAAFQAKYKVDMKSVAAKLWQISPAGKKYRAEMANV